MDSRPPHEWPPARRDDVLTNRLGLACSQPRPRRPRSPATAAAPHAATAQGQRERFYYLSDAIGSVLVVSDGADDAATGLRPRYGYDPYGQAHGAGSAARAPDGHATDAGDRAELLGEEAAGHAPHLTARLPARSYSAANSAHSG